MLTEEEFVYAMALRRRGWTISAIARHLGCDRKTIRGWVEGQREPGARRRAVPDYFEPFVAYVAARLVADPHLWGTALYDEVVGLGYPRSYVTFVREVRLAWVAAALRGVLGRKGPSIDRDRASAR